MQRRLLLFLSIILCSFLVACGDLPAPETDRPNPIETETPDELPDKPEPEPNSPEPTNPEPSNPTPGNPEPSNPTPGNPEQPNGSLNPELQEVLRLVNEVRSQGTTCGGERFGSVGPLTLEPRLTTAAQKHSEDMAAAQKMQHDTPAGAIHYEAGSSPWDRIKAEGYQMRGGGENVAAGYQNAEAVMNGWLNSPGHCRNIMGDGFTEIGLGVEERYWTQVFANR